MFFLDFEKNLKKRKKRTHSFTGHLITQPLILNYRLSGVWWTLPFLQSQYR